MTNIEFIEMIKPYIIDQAVKRGYKYPSAIIAIACNESNYGRSLLASKYYNYFGMKCGNSWKGASINLKTKEEYQPGILTNIRDNFRVYPNTSIGVEGFFDFIDTIRYQNLKDVTSPLSFIRTIKNDGYATDSNYVDKVYNILCKYNLHSIDPTYDKITEVAKEVIAGEWGNGSIRKKRLFQAGYNYNEVQNRVNILLKGG